MKKLIALISAVAVIGSMSLTSLAAIEVTPNAEAAGAALAIKDGGYEASYASDAVNTQTTILAVKGAEITTNSIQYINQLAQDSETAIPFALKDELAVGETVKVYMGGDAIAKTEIGTIANVADPVVKYTVTFYDEDGTTVLGTSGEVESGAALVAPANPTKAEDAEYTYAFAGWAVKGTTDVVALPATVTANAEYVAVYTATAKPAGGEIVEFVLGDVTGDDAVKAADYGAVKVYVKAGSHTRYAIGESISGTEYILGDVTGDGAVKAADYGAIKVFVKAGSHTRYDIGDTITVTK